MKHYQGPFGGIRLPDKLSKDEYGRLFKIMESKSQDSQEARGRIIEHSLKLVVSMANKCTEDTNERDELISLGNIGLIKAVDSFRPSKGYCFSTYAITCIKNEMFMHFRKQKSKFAMEAPLEAPIEPSDNSKPSLPTDKLKAKSKQLKAKVDVARDYDRKFEKEALCKEIGKLPKHKQVVIMLRYGLGKSGETMTQKEIAKMMGKSQSQISKIEKNTLKELGKILRPLLRN